MKNLILICAVSALLNTQSFASEFNMSEIKACVNKTTVVINSEEMSLNSERAIAETINEIPLDVELAPVAQKIAACFGIETWTILAAIEGLYYDESTISIDNIATFIDTM